MLATNQGLPSHGKHIFAKERAWFEAKKVCYHGYTNLALYLNRANNTVQVYLGMTGKARHAIAIVTLT